MVQIITPLTLFHTQVTTLQAALPSVLDGQEAGIHDARIATRRLRELLPLLGGDPRSASLDDLRARFRRMGRSLGRVRDADVRLALLASLEDRIPHAAPTLVVVRQQRERERQALIRKLIKRLERLDALRLIGALARQTPSRLAAIGARSPGTKWRRELRGAVIARAEAAGGAIAHATGVYFPNRAHAARIAIKRLRYATEIVHDTGIADRTIAIRELKKAQDLLGDLHDRQELSDHLAADTARMSSGSAAAVEQVALIRQAIDAEARRLHERYLARRERLMAVCRESLAMPRWTSGRAPVLALATLALTSGVYAVWRHERRLAERPLAERSLAERSLLHAVAD